MDLKAKIIQENNMFWGRENTNIQCNLIIATGGHKHTWLCNLGVKFEIQNCGVDLLEHKNSTFLEVKRLKANVKSVIYFENSPLTLTVCFSSLLSVDPSSQTYCPASPSSAKPMTNVEPLLDPTLEISTENLFLSLFMMLSPMAKNCGGFPELLSSTFFHMMTKFSERGKKCHIFNAFRI